MILAFCLGIINVTCSVPVAEVSLTAQPVPIQHVLSVDRAGQTTAVITLNGATFVSQPAVTKGIIGSFSPTLFTVIGATGIEASGFVLNISSANIGDTVTATLRIFDPNTATTLVETTVPLVEVTGVERFEVPFFNPASNTNQQTFLRIAANGGAVVATITGTDDAGNKSRRMDVLVESGHAMQINSSALEAQIGAPVGKYRLKIDADATGLMVQGLVRNNQTGTVSAISDTISHKRIP